MKRFAVGNTIIIKAMVQEAKEHANLVLPKGKQVNQLVHEKLNKYFDVNPFRGEVILVGDMVNTFETENGIIHNSGESIMVGDIVFLKDEQRLMWPLLIEKEEYYAITKNDITIVERSYHEQN